jgi:S-(hydroxymethyl)glutathione dehydrogenase / alcohol dehydrogenase
MKAAVLTQLNAPLQLLDLEPQMVKQGSVCANGQVLVDVIVSGICGAQLKEIQGEKGNADFLPHLLGHEGCVRIREVGPGVSVQLKGRKAVAHWRKGAGPEAFLPARYDGGNGKSVGGGHVTTLCQQAVVSANRLTTVPEDVPDELCALLGCGLSTALGTIEQEAKVRFGESVLIVGCGGVGLNLILAAKLAQAWPIVGMDVVEEKRSVVLQLHADTYVNSKIDSVLDTMNAFGLKGFDVIVDTSGSVEAIEVTMPLLSETGRYILLGQPKPGQALKIEGALHMFHGEHGKRIMATQGGGFRPSVDIPRYIQLWRSGALKLDGVVSHRLPLTEINRGIDLVRAGQAGRIMVYPQEK